MFSEAFFADGADLVDGDFRLFSRAGDSDAAPPLGMKLCGERANDNGVEGDIHFVHADDEDGTGFVDFAA